MCGRVGEKINTHSRRKEKKTTLDLYVEMSSQLGTFLFMFQQSDGRRKEEDERVNAFSKTTRQNKFMSHEEIN